MSVNLTGWAVRAGGLASGRDRGSFSPAMRPRFPTFPRRALPPRVWRWLLLLNLTAGVLVGGWYLFQPAGRQAEVDRLVSAALARDKRVGFLEVAWDVWNLYYAGSGTGPWRRGTTGSSTGASPG